MSKYALLSVSDKTDINRLAQHLVDAGYRLLSTGGTFARLEDKGLPVLEVSAHTGFKEMMDGRVKTLHPKIHGGILGRRGLDDEIMADHGISPIDIVVVNLYPFAKTIEQADCTLDLAIENIDIGGPAMVRSAAKNMAHVAVVTDPADYDDIIDALKTDRLDLAMRRRLAQKAFAHTADYDAMIARYLSEQFEDNASSFPARIAPQFTKKIDLRYGENPHQNAAFYVESGTTSGTLADYVQHQGKALSYNNIADTDAAFGCVCAFDDPACVIVKHANPCGVAIDNDQLAAYKKAFATDPESAFGGIIAFNRPLTLATAQAICAQQFVEVIIAPKLEEGVLEATAAKKNVRILTCTLQDTSACPLDYKRVSGGLLVQDMDTHSLNSQDLIQAGDLAPTEAQIEDLLFAWNVAKFVKSNAIIYAKDKRTIGIGAGQMSRVNSARIASIKAQHAGLDVSGAVMASDAFFPFRDGIDNAAQAGIKAIIQPGGSMRDEETIAAANEHKIAMVFTGVRHFRH